MKTNIIKKVLIALDYDPTAQRVAELGFSIANTMKAKIVLLHVINEPKYYSVAGYSPIMGFSGYINEGMQLIDIDDLKKASLHYLNKTKHHLGDENIESIVQEGDFAETILKTAQNMHVDIIVMGSHSRKWLENILLGSVTEKVLRLTNIPLMIIPTKKNK